MTEQGGIAPTKTHRGENFPVASALIAPRHRPVVLAFYRFARAADDVADHPTLSETEKFARLDALEQTLLGHSDSAQDALPLRAVLAERKLSPRHAQDLLTAFRMDVTKRRYANWDELIHYCTYSAMPVGRFVLDVHGESRDTWPANDALCAALQIINHLQDCAKDFRALDRVYIPLDALLRDGLTVDALGEPTASPALRRVIAQLAQRTDTLLDQSEAFAARIRDLRLGIEVAVIQRVARKLNAGLKVRDPLSERVHHSKAEFLAVGAVAAAGELLRRLTRPTPRTGHKAQDA
ncbi:MAG: squalene synthase HpnC [Pseudorhodoplanes sp.]|nr:squalene synthase HpnC [Pseudorhodoplanes sp.]